MIFSPSLPSRVGFWGVNHQNTKMRKLQNTNLRKYINFQQQLYQKSIYLYKYLFLIYPKFILLNLNSQNNLKSSKYNIIAIYCLININFLHYMLSKKPLSLLLLILSSSSSSSFLKFTSSLLIALLSSISLSCQFNRIASCRQRLASSLCANTYYIPPRGGSIFKVFIKRLYCSLKLRRASRRKL